MSTHAEHGMRGILAPATLLAPWLHLVLFALVATSTWRYLERHGLEDNAVPIMFGAATLMVLYAVRPLARERMGWLVAWTASLVLLWGALTLAAPSFAWCAVPVAFSVLSVLPEPWAMATLAAMMLAIALSWARIGADFDPTLVVGPLGIAVVTVMSVRALARQSREREVLLQELTAAQEGLVRAERRAGALTERARLSRDIHDSVGQDLSSINLLLQAAGQSWDTRPAEARENVSMAAASAREGLDSIRRLVRDFAGPPAGDEAEPGPGPVRVAGQQSLDERLRHAITATVPGMPVEFHSFGSAPELPAEIAEALVFTTRGALANVREHARATRVAVTLTCNDDEVLLDIRDDGIGCDPGAAATATLRGHGLRGIRERALALGGTFELDSTPGEGTTVSVRFTLEDS
ncbi:sensor histidine kinase [Paeniglutamicibacter sp. R2-26]|uniref:sensor histidine kinase n=1 Tax=Paeniglutamicibacter sp. R2-26 TaxID=3144417 RepID=UPI003EE67935